MTTHYNADAPLDLVRIHFKTFTLQDTAAFMILRILTVQSLLSQQGNQDIFFLGPMMIWLNFGVGESTFQCLWMQVWPEQLELVLQQFLHLHPKLNDICMQNLHKLLNLRASRLVQ